MMLKTAERIQILEKCQHMGTDKHKISKEMTKESNYHYKMADRDSLGSQL